MWWEIFGTWTELLGQTMVVGGLLVLQWVLPEHRDERRWFVFWGFVVSAIGSVMFALAGGHGELQAFLHFLITAVGASVAFGKYYSGAHATKFGITNREYIVWTTILLSLFLRVVMSHAISSSVAYLSVGITMLYLFFVEAWVGIIAASLFVLFPYINTEKDVARRERRMQILGLRTALVWPIFFGSTIITGLYIVWANPWGVGLKMIFVFGGAFVALGFYRTFFTSSNSSKVFKYLLTLEACFGVVLLFATSRLLVLFTFQKPTHPVSFTLTILSIGILIALATAFMARITAERIRTGLR